LEELCEIIIFFHLPVYKITEVGLILVAQESWAKKKGWGVLRALIHRGRKPSLNTLFSLKKMSFNQKASFNIIFRILNSDSIGVLYLQFCCEGANEPIIFN
jgi:hypothetical protein